MDTTPTLLTVSASPRRDSSTAEALNIATEAALDAWPALARLHVDLARREVRPCIGCWSCRDEFRCVIKDDFQQIMQEIAASRVVAILFATPVYMGSMSAQGKAFWDRSIVFRCRDFAWRNASGGAIATGGSRNGGQELTLQGIHAAMGIHDMIIVSDSAHFGGTVWTRGESAASDEEGVVTLTRLGGRVAQVARAIERSAG